MPIAIYVDRKPHNVNAPKRKSIEVVPGQPSRPRNGFNPSANVQRTKIKRTDVSERSHWRNPVYGRETKIKEMADFFILTHCITDK